MTTKQDYISNVTNSLRHLNDGVHPEHTQIEDELATRCLNMAATLADRDAEIEGYKSINMELKHRLRAVGA